MADKLKGKSTNYIINKTAEVFLTEIPVCPGDEVNSYFLGLTQSANIQRAISTEEIKAGVAGKTIGVIKLDDGMSFSVTTGVHYEEVMEIQMGSKFVEMEDAKIFDITQDGSTFEAEEVAVRGSVMELDAKNLPRNYKVQMRSEAIDPKSGATVADVYWNFYRANPDGNLDEGFDLGTNKTQVIDFTALAEEGTDSYGQYIVVPRDVATCEDKTPPGVEG